MIAGEKPSAAGGLGFPSGLGTQLFDKEHNLSPGERWEPPVDFQAAFLKGLA